MARTVQCVDLKREGEGLETVVVARFAGKSSLAGRVGAMPGAELRQALARKLGSPAIRSETLR